MSLAGLQEVNPFELLGVTPSIDDVGLRKAYWALAKKLHPDARPDDPGAVDRFARVNVAYEELSDPVRRRAAEQRWASSAGTQATSLDQGFEDFFATAGTVGRGARAQTEFRMPRRGRRADIRREITLTLEEAFTGGRFEAPGTRGPCLACSGEGMVETLQETVCPTCDGLGSASRAKGIITVEVECPTCHGRKFGHVAFCGVCGGRGATDSGNVAIEIIAGVRDGYVVRVTEGVSDEDGSSGELQVTVRVAEHPRFRRSDEHLELDYPLPMSVAALGAKASLKGIDGAKIGFVVPPGSQSGDLIEIKESGMPAFSGRGDLRVSLKVVTPDGSDPKIRPLLEQLRALGS